MSTDACAALVARGDPDRFAAAMTAPPEKRGRLMALYAFNLEVARAPWVTSEAMLAEMRLQWWADALSEIFDGHEVRRHEVVTPLAAAITEAGLPRGPFEALIAARRADIYPDPPESAEALAAYLDATAGGLAELAARALGADDRAAAVARQFGRAQGAATLIAALPALEAAGRRPLPIQDARETAIGALASEALGWLAEARRGRGSVGPGLRAVFLSGPVVGWALRGAQANPAHPPEPSEFRRRASRMAVALTGRW